MVNAVIKEYVAQNPNITFSDLERTFPKSIQGSNGVFDTKENAEEIYNRTNQKRHHLNPKQLIGIKDSTIATCTQWNPINTQKFIHQVHKVSNLKIEVV